MLVQKLRNPILSVEELLPPYSTVGLNLLIGFSPCCYHALSLLCPATTYSRNWQNAVYYMTAMTFDYAMAVAKPCTYGLPRGLRGRVAACVLYLLLTEPKPISFISSVPDFNLTLT